MYVPFFRCELFPYMIGFIALCFSVIPPALPSFSFLSLSCPFQFPFVSLSFPVAFLTCGLPISSPHFLALPCISPLLPSISRKTYCFSSVFAKRTSKNTEFFQMFPCTSLHFPLAPQYFPPKTRFSSVFAKRTSKNTEFSRFSAKASRKPKPAKSRQGNRAWHRACFATTAARRLCLVERHQIAGRYVGEGAGRGTKPCVIDVSGGGTMGGLSSILS